MSMTSSPCKGCENRTVEPNCHNPDRCEKWAEFQRIHQHEKDVIYENVRKERTGVQHLIKTIQENKKRSRRRR